MKFEEINPLAMTYCPWNKSKYRKRWYVSLLCSEWEKVVPYRSDHQGIHFFKNQRTNSLNYQFSSLKVKEKNIFIYSFDH